jgi:hypothetical protein
LVVRAAMNFVCRGVEAYLEVGGVHQKKCIHVNLGRFKLVGVVL